MPGKTRTKRYSKASTRSSNERVSLAQFVRVAELATVAPGTPNAGKCVQLLQSLRNGANWDTSEKAARPMRIGLGSARGVDVRLDGVESVQSFATIISHFRTRVLAEACRQAGEIRGIVFQKVPGQESARELVWSKLRSRARTHVGLFLSGPIQNGPFIDPSILGVRMMADLLAVRVSFFWCEPDSILNHVARNRITHVVISMGVAANSQLIEELTAKNVRVLIGGGDAIPPASAVRQKDSTIGSEMAEIVKSHIRFRSCESKVLRLLPGDAGSRYHDGRSPISYRDLAATSLFEKDSIESRPIAVVEDPVSIRVKLKQEILALIKEHTSNGVSKADRKSRPKSDVDSNAPLPQPFIYVMAYSALYAEAAIEAVYMARAQSYVRVVQSDLTAKAITQMSEPCDDRRPPDADGMIERPVLLGAVGADPFSYGQAALRAALMVDPDKAITTPLPVVTLTPENVRGRIRTTTDLLDAFPDLRLEGREYWWDSWMRRRCRHYLKLRRIGGPTNG